MELLLHFKGRTLMERQKFILAFVIVNIGMRTAII
jgi:hypothetical protein